MAICGKQTEVYSRIVGYHRPVKNWNKGKRAEFEDRREFTKIGAPLEPHPPFEDLRETGKKYDSPSTGYCEDVRGVRL